MSIINEALKKTERSIQENSNLANPPNHNKNTFKLYLLYGLILLSGLALSNYIFNLINQNTKAKIASIKETTLPLELTKLATTLKTETKTISPQIANSLIEEPAIKQKSDTNFVLNGIFFSDNDAYALINNQIVRENDLIDGAKIVKITVRNVEIDNAGQIITLTTLR